ncbi:MAG: DegQ family serine endoprotease [Xanthomonadaceae bacterium]|nr:DegQ family serine endoprotease [Xanthomonadaceae bacterium]
MKSLSVLLASLMLLLSGPVFGQLANLPDFTELVDVASPAVVNIEATRTAQSAPSMRTPDGEEVPEFFRRFFGQPGMPRAPQDQVSGGSGFIISGDGDILTNHHVIDGADIVVVRLPDRREFEAKVIGSDPLSDVALLRIEAKNLPTLKIGNSGALKAGQWVMAIGSPFGFLENTVTAGIVSGVGRRSLDPSQNYVPFIQTDVAINRGNSGGPLLNTDGEVVGINSQIFSNSGGFMGVSFAIPIDVAMNAARQIKESGRVRRGQLGVIVQQVTREAARSFGMRRSVGALVSDVLPDSAAERAGIEIGDVILEFNGTEIVQSSDLPPVVGATAPGTDARVLVLRAGERKTLTVKLDELPSDQAAAAAAADGPASGGALGVVVETPSAQMRDELGLSDGEGVLVSEVTGAAARRAGLRPGDVILRVGRTVVTDHRQFARLVENTKAGDTVMLLVRRGDQNQFLALSPREGE